MQFTVESVSISNTVGISYKMIYPGSDHYYGTHLIVGVRWLVRKRSVLRGHVKFFLLTQTGKFIGVRCVNNVNEGLQLELSNGRVFVVVEHGEPEGRLDLVRTLLENGT